MRRRGKGLENISTFLHIFSSIQLRTDPSKLPLAGVRSILQCSYAAVNATVPQLTITSDTCYICSYTNRFILLFYAFYVLRVRSVKISIRRQLWNCKEVEPATRVESKFSSNSLSPACRVSRVLHEKSSSADTVQMQKFQFLVLSAFHIPVLTILMTQDNFFALLQ